MDSDTGFTWLGEGNRRLATLCSLKIEESSWRKNLSSDVITSLVAECDGYFERNPYRWFNPLDQVLRQLGHTYCGPNASACHLDLSPWATSPVWGRLGKAEQEILVDNGRQLLEAQVGEGNIALILINGATVAKKIERAFGLSFEEVSPRVIVPGKETSSSISYSNWNGVTVIAWSVNLQSSFGVTNELKQKLAEQVRELTSLRTA
jgi:hypothetical protein